MRYSFTLKMCFGYLTQAWLNISWVNKYFSDSTSQVSEKSLRIYLVYAQVNGGQQVSMLAWQVVGPGFESHIQTWQQ